MERFKKFLILAFSLISLGAVALGMSCAVNSNLFMLQRVEVRSSLKDPPLDDQTILNMAAVPVGKVSLFALNLKTIESRLLASDLIREVSLQKSLPRTLIISVIYKAPKALIQTMKGSLAYVDSEGKVFSSLNLLATKDLPLLTGFSNQGPDRVREALNLLEQWENSHLNDIALISSIHWDTDRGFRVLATYSLGGKTLTAHSNFNERIRTTVDFGETSPQNLKTKLFQLSKVFRYLGGNAIASRQVWADAGKKIVVKTAHGS